MSKGRTLGVLTGFVALLALSPIASGATVSRACWLRDAVSPAPTIVYGLCEQGRLYVTRDSGATWSTSETGAEVTLRSLAFVDATHGLIAGDRGTILASDDAGKTWQARKSGTTNHLLTLFSVGNDVWAGGYDGILLHSSDAGRTWEQQKTPSGLAIESIYFLDAVHGWAVGWAGTILRTADGGKNWEAIKTSAASWSLSGVYFKDLKVGWVVGFQGQLMRSDDGGTTWKAQPPKDAKGEPIRVWLKGITADSANRIWVAADDQLLMSADGQTWTAKPTADLLFLRDFVHVGDSLWAIGQLGALKLSSPGTDWKSVDTLVVGGSTKDVLTTTVKSDSSQ
jgi:photosystem II stability/assembly factor-like uncharacterized protein